MWTKVSESGVVRSENLSSQQWRSCNNMVCLEENRVCKCTTDDDHDQRHSQANGSFSHAVLNMIGMLIGLGQLSTPYALQNGGWCSGFLLVGLGIICAYTSHILGKCLQKNPKLSSYTDIGQEAFGRKGRIVAATFIYIEIFMALVSYTISLHDNLITVFSGTGSGTFRIPATNLSSSQLLTAIAVFIALPSLWLRDLSSISFLSFGGILMSLVIFGSVAFTAISGAVKPIHKIPVLQLRKIPAISGLYVFSYAGHIVFPNLYKSMKDPSHFTKVSIVSFTSVTALYTGLAVMGAKMFGSSVNSQITLSLPNDQIITKIALWATVLTPMTKYALEFAPFAIQLEQNLPASMAARTKMIVRGCIGSLLLILILVLALSVPYFQYVLSLTGSLISVCICIILPCIFYVKTCWSGTGDDRISKLILILNLILIVFGCVIGVFGTISSFKSLAEHLNQPHSDTT